MGPVSLQPAEFAKFGTALALARFMDRYEFSIDRLKDSLLAAAIFMIPMVLIILQNETGSALVYMAFLLVLYRESIFLEEGIIVLQVRYLLWVNRSSCVALHAAHIKNRKRK